MQNKMFIVLGLSAIFLLATAAFSWSSSNIMAVAVTLENMDQLRAIELQRLNITNRSGLRLELAVDEIGLTKLKDLGFKPEPIERAPSEIKDGYHGYDGTVASMESIVANYPDLAYMGSAGTSFNGHDIPFIVLGNMLSESGPDRSVVWFDASIHGDEWVGYELAIRFAEYLVAQYGSNADVTNLLNTRWVLIVPIVNPDGVIADMRYNGNDVDCNRNYPFYWESEGGSSAGSEPEVRAMVELARLYRPATCVSYHGGALYVNYLWDSTPNPSPDEPEIIVISQGYADLVSGQEIINGYDWYRITGSSEESYYGMVAAHSAIIELGDKQPSISEMLAIAADNFDAMIYWGFQAGQGIEGYVSDSVTGQPLLATLWLQPTGWPAISDPGSGFFTRHLPVGTHSMVVTSQGYNNLTLNSVVVASETPTSRDVYLTPKGSFEGFAVQCPAVFKSDPNLVFNNTSDPYMALGLPDGQAYHLGVSGWVVLDFGPNGIDNVSGDDFTVVQTAGTAENYKVYAGNEWWGPWTLIGSGSGTASFDLDDGSMQSARYIKILDNNPGENPNLADAGFDLDAITFARDCDAPQFTVHADPVHGGAPLQVSFWADYTGYPGCVTSVSWSFGDSGSSSQGKPTHTYNNEGTYDVTLSASGPGGTTPVTVQDMITVGCIKAVPDFTAQPRQGPAPMAVQFTDQTQNWVNCDPSSYLWDFGDGNNSTQRNPSHTYEQSGAFDVTLTVTNSAGTSSVEKQDYIAVSCSYPVADFSGTPTTGGAPLEVHFSDLSIAQPECPITTWNWIFGDGQTSGDQNPVHTYNANGQYTVTLQVYNAIGGDAESKYHYIIVSGATTTTVTTTTTTTTITTTTTGGSTTSTTTVTSTTTTTTVPIDDDTSDDDTSIDDDSGDDDTDDDTGDDDIDDDESDDDTADDDIVDDDTSNNDDDSGGIPPSDDDSQGSSSTNSGCGC